MGHWFVLKGELVVWLLGFLKRGFDWILKLQDIIFILREEKPWLHRYLQIQEDEARKLSAEIYALILQTKKGEFFPGVIEKIKELSQDFKLFLSTGNSTAFAKENLQEWWILNCFELVVGSDLLIKGGEHLKLFSEAVGDPNFLKKVVFIWDGENDRDIAQQAGVPFIHVEEEPCSFDVPYCVVSVADISGPLAQIINEKREAEF